MSSDAMQFEHLDVLRCYAGERVNDVLMSSKIPEWFNVIILSTQLTDIAKAADSFPGVALSLNNNESSNKYLSVIVSVLLIATLWDGNLLCAKYKYTSLKYGL